MAATFRWDDPFRTGFAGTYDPGTMYGLYFRARGGDAAAKNHLAQAGFFDQYGNDTYGAGNNYLQATDNWAKAKNLGVYRGESPFQWDSSWYAPGAANADPRFNTAWDSFWNKQAQNPTAPGAPAPPATQGGTNTLGEPLYDADGFYQGFAPGWAYGGDQLGGSRWDGSKWVAGSPLAAGFNVRQAIDGRGGSPVVSKYGYDPRADRYRFELNGKQGESAWSRAVRRASDNMRDRGLNAQAAWDDAVNSVIRDAQTVGAPSPFTSTAPAAPGQQPGQQPGAPGAPPAVPNAAPGLPNTTVADAAKQQGGTVFNTQPGQLTAAQKMALGADPQQAYRWMLQQIGVNPDMPGMLGNFLQKRFQPLLEARLATAGLQGGGNDAAYLDRIDEVIRNFGTSFTDKSQGGNFFQGLQTMANDALQQGGGFLNNLKDQGQAQQYLNQLASLRFAGVNPLIQQSMADQLSTAQNLYNDASFNDITFNDPYQQWLRRQEKYRSIFGF